VVAYHCGLVGARWRLCFVVEILKSNTGKSMLLPPGRWTAVSGTQWAKGAFINFMGDRHIPARCGRCAFPSLVPIWLGGP
jgi:hypothetical protein